MEQARRELVVEGRRRRGDGRGLIQLGLLVLVATPVARVAGSLIAFVFLRDRTYVVLTSIVLLLLASSLAAVVF